MQPYYQKKLNSTQTGVLTHLIKCLGASQDSIEYEKSLKYVYESSSVDFATIQGGVNADYNVISTVGLSDMALGENKIRLEVMLVLPSWWHIHKKGYDWPVKLFKDIVDNIKNESVPICINGVYSSLNGEYKSNSDSYSGGILTLPELLPEEISYTQINKRDTVFLMFTPLTTYQMSKIKEVGIENFVNYDLHDAEGNFVENYGDKPVTSRKRSGGAIDKIISHNEDSLMGK